MSWRNSHYHAKRYNNRNTVVEPRFPFERYGIERHKNRHHTPPKSRGGTKTFEVDTVQHRAYHILFGNAATLGECIDILKRDWWNQ